MVNKLVGGFIVISKLYFFSLVYLITPPPMILPNVSKRRESWRYCFSWRAIYIPLFDIFFCSLVLPFSLPSALPSALDLVLARYVFRKERQETRCLLRSRGLRKGHVL